MSKTTLDSGPILRYLNQLAIKGEWLDMWLQNSSRAGKKSVACVDDDGGITIYGASHTWKTGQIVPVIYVCIKLMSHQKQPVFLIERFEVFSGEGSDRSFKEVGVLKHYNKDFAVPADSVINDLSKLWTISCAKDLESLLRAHDNLAKFYGYPTFFNIP